ncbi:MAG: DUF3500 domain-containing protein, partial [Bacteroidetes bacterium]
MYRLLLLLLLASLGWACADLSSREQAPAAVLDVSAEMTQAALRVLESLSPPLQERVLFPFDAEERKNWNYLPLKDQRKGVPIEEMDAPQREAVFALLETALSDLGAQKVHEIMALERVLHQLEGRGTDDRYRNPEAYFLTIFGQPGDEAPWGWRYEGHHISLNFSAVSGQGLSVTPAFLGSNPGEVREGPQEGTEVLRAEQAVARRLVQALDSGQLAQAWIAQEAPFDIVTTNEPRVNLERREGLPGHALLPAQRDSLARLIRLYTSKMD